MKPHPRQYVHAALMVLVLVSLACQLPQTAISTPTSLPITPLSSQVLPTASVTAQASQPPRPTARATSPPVVAHRIATHRIYGIAEFYDRLSGQAFVPRGVNYFIYVPVLDHYEDRLLAVGIYDHNRTLADFTALAAAGYNSVRITLDGCTSGDSCIGNVDAPGLNPAYLDNIADLMSLAKETGLSLLLALSNLPESGGYALLASQGLSPEFASSRNVAYLTSAGIQASHQYWSDLLAGLVTRQAPLEIVLGWEIQNEQYYWGDQPPFSLENGKVTPANGKTYDMSLPADKQALAVEGLRFYIDQVSQAIKSYDPTALVTMGFFAPGSPNLWREGDNRYVEMAGLLSGSNLDFFDLHAYPGAGLSLSEQAENFGLGSHLTRPVLMGEVGAYTWVYPQVGQGAIAVQDWIAASCSQGITGWFYYGYYPTPSGLVDATWGLVDEKNTLLTALSPHLQPDACTTTILPGRNLALGKPVSVSAALPEQTPQMAVDGDPNTQWSAGAFPTQWIEIDLGAAYSVGEIRLTVGQWPAGTTVHQLWVGAAQDSMQQVYEFSGREVDFDVLDFLPAAPLPGIRYVRVVTTESPAWVAWREIEVLAPFAPTPAPTPGATATPTPF